MRHQKHGRKLNRSPSHRRALLRSLAQALIRHESIETTLPKAREARRFVERLVTIARKGTLPARREVARRLRDEEATKRLFEEVAPRFVDRPGGYTRILKLAERRKCDGTQLCLLEFVEFAPEEA